MVSVPAPLVTAAVLIVKSIVLLASSSAIVKAVVDSLTRLLNCKSSLTFCSYTPAPAPRLEAVLVSPVAPLAAIVTIPSVPVPVVVSVTPLPSASCIEPPLLLSVTVCVVASDVLASVCNSLVVEASTGVNAPAIILNPLANVRSVLLLAASQPANDVAVPVRLEAFKVPSISTVAVGAVTLPPNLLSSS